MSAVEIFAELPRLTDDERSAGRRRLLELEEQKDRQFLHASAATMFLEMDQKETENGSRQTR